MTATIRPAKTPTEKTSDVTTGLASTPGFVHLKAHSAFSLLEGALPIKKLASLTEHHGMPALALTDSNNLFGALEFCETFAGNGLQPIVGVSLSVGFDGPENRDPNVHDQTSGNANPRDPKANGQINFDVGRLTLLAATHEGYGNLLKLVSRAHLLSPAATPQAQISEFEGHTDGIIALTGGEYGPVDVALKNDQHAEAGRRLDRLKALFGDRLYVEIQRHGTRGGSRHETALLKLAYDHTIPLVATNEIYFEGPDDFEAHDALLCIAEGRYVVEDDRRRVTPDHCFKSAEAMHSLFADLPEALANTIEIARRCHVRSPARDPILPRFVSETAEGGADALLKAEADELRRQAEQGLRDRLKVIPLADGFTEKDYFDRLAFELDIIIRMKFPGYFLIVADFIQWTKAQGIPVGPGRGSGAGSVVAWALTITDLDPLRFGLLFERFLNPERVSMPDFDIDFCQDRRDEVIQYVQQKYGADRVAQIITHGKLQARAVLRDVGRVLQMPYGQVDRLCKLVPNNPANPVTLQEAIAGEPKFQEEADREPIVERLLEISDKLEGLYRHASTHAAGIVIGDRPLDELVPLYRDPKSDAPVTQFNWKMVERAGLVKFDFLGLKTLTVLQKAVELIAKGHGIEIDLAKVALDDGPTFELLAKADTVGVFQLESTGMRESLKRLKPDRFEDIIAMVALYRPGPMDNIPTYINRKHGEEEVDCLHDLLEPILKETYGVIIYQEQVMQIAQVMAGYTLGEADLLRRAMGKKDKREMAKQRARFVDGAVKNGVKKSDAAFIFELVDKFAGYGFNKSHAAAYALVSYHTAYLKANFREEFLAASMTLDMQNTDKLALFSSEAKRSGIAVLPPSVNDSGVEFSAEPPRNGAQRGAIRYSLAALKNIGASAVETIVSERDQNGPYRSLADVAGRLKTKAVNKRALETLAAAGAFDDLEANRARVHGNVDVILEQAQRSERNAADGTMELFGAVSDAGNDLVLRRTQSWTETERLQKEFEAVGLFLSGHPLDQYKRVLEKLNVTPYSEFEAKTDLGTSTGRLAGIVVSARARRSQRGNKFAFAMFSDTSGQFEAVLFSDTLAAAGDLLEPGTAVLLRVEAERDGDTVKMRAQSLESLDAAAAKAVSGLSIHLDLANVNDTPRCLQEVKAALSAHQLPDGTNGPGSGVVRLVLDANDGGENIAFHLKPRYDVSPSHLGRLKTIDGVAKVDEF